MAKLQITLTRSVIGRPETQRKTVEALGLKKTNSSVVVEDNPATVSYTHLTLPTSDLV